MSPVKPRQREVLLSSLVKNSIVYLVAVLFGQKYPMVSVTVVGLANLSCSYDDCMNGENEPDVKQRDKGLLPQN